MTMSEGNDEDAIARRLLDEVDFVFDMDMLQSTPYTEMTTPELLNRFEDVKDTLGDLGETLDPRTPAGIDAHAIYHGILLELKNRGAI